MSANIQNILTVYASIGEQVLKDALDKVSATNKTVASVRSEVTSTDTSDRMQLIARKFTELLETGRGPTSKGPSPEMIELLTEYARARGMEKPEKAAWGIAKKINKIGDNTYRSGGRDVYSLELDKFVDELKTECKKSFVGSSLKAITNQFK